MSSYISFAEISAAPSLHLIDGHTGMSSTRRLAPIPLEIAPKRSTSTSYSPSSSPAISSSSFFTAPFTSTSNFTSTSAHLASRPTSINTSTFESSSPSPAPSSRPASSSTASSSAFSLLSSASRSSICSPSVVLEDVTYLGGFEPSSSSSSTASQDDDSSSTSSQDDDSSSSPSSRIPIEHLESLVQRYDALLHAAQAERDALAAAEAAQAIAAAEEAALASAKRIEAAIRSQAERLAALTARLTPNPSFTPQEIKEMERACSLDNRTMFRPDPLPAGFRDSAIYLKGIQLEHQLKKFGYIEDEVVDCYWVIEELYGWTEEERMRHEMWQGKSREIESQRKSKRPLYKKVLGLFA